jgi:hypothetical protein
MNCAFFAGWTLLDLLMCTITNLGIPFDLVSLGILAAFTLFALWARIDYNLALGAAAALTYILIMMFPGSTFLPIILGLLAIGIAVRVLIGIIAMLRQ